MAKIVKPLKDTYFIDDKVIDAIILQAPVDALITLLPGGNNQFMEGLYFHFDINLNSKRGEKYKAAIWDWQGDRSTCCRKECVSDAPGLAIRNLVGWYIKEYVPSLEIDNYIRNDCDRKKWDDLMYIRNALESLRIYV